jgi:hypothetical protein
VSTEQTPVDLDEAQRICKAAGNSLEVEYDTCDCDYPCDHKPFAIGIRARHATVRLELSDFAPAVWVEAIAKAPALLAQVVAELRECRTQRDENLANVRRIDDLRIAETARLNGALDAADEVAEFARYVDQDAPEPWRKFSTAMDGLRKKVRAYEQARAGEGA